MWAVGSMFSGGVRVVLCFLGVVVLHLQQDCSARRPYVGKRKHCSSTPHSHHSSVKFSSAPQIPLLETSAQRLPRARQIISSVACGLQHMHSKGVVHEDIKPENILLRRQGSNEVLISDFGISARWDKVAKQKNIAGSPTWMAPEAYGRDDTEKTFRVHTQFSPFSPRSIIVCSCDVVGHGIVPFGGLKKVFSESGRRGHGT